MISNHDENVRTYLINVVAWMMQNPSKILRVCIILIGKAGTGKDLFWRFIGECLLGSQFYTNVGAKSKRLLFGDFTKHATNAILVHAEEVKMAVNREFRDQLFSMITSTTSVSESKGVDAIAGDCYANYVMTSNSDTPLKRMTEDLSLSRHHPSVKPVSRVMLDGGRRFETNCILLLCVSRPLRSSLESTFHHLIRLPIAQLPMRTRQ
jgi:hypothetical protein